MVMLPMNNTSKTDVAPRCYRWAGLDGMDWVGSLSGVDYRALFGANKVAIVMVAIGTKWMVTHPSNALACQMDGPWVTRPEC